VRIVHVDNYSQGRSATSRMLQAGISSYNSSLDQGQAQIDFCGLKFDDYSQRAAVVDDKSSVFAISVAERDLTIKDEQNGPLPCRSIRTAYDIVMNRPGTKVFLVPVSGGGPLTGVDAVIAMLVGITGIIDERGLVLNEVIGAMMRPPLSSRRQKSMLLVGEVASRTEITTSMVASWNMDEEGDPTLDGACWRAAMALGQIGKLEPMFTSPQPLSFSSLAAALNLSESTTYFRLNENDLRRVLSTLARRWLHDGHKPADRILLPECARRHGMPRHRPMLPNQDCTRTDRATHAALLAADLVTQPDLDQMTRRIIRLTNFSIPRKRI
jgi:hypothetical protein